VPPAVREGIRGRIAARVVGLEEGGQLDLVSGRLAMHMVRAKMLAAGEDPGTPNEIVLSSASSGRQDLALRAGRDRDGPPAGDLQCGRAQRVRYVGLSAEDGLRGVLLGRARFASRRRDLA